MDIRLGELGDNRQVVTAAHGLTFRARGAALLELMLAPAPQRIEAATQGAIDEALRLGRDPVPADEPGRVRGLLERDLGVKVLLDVFDGSAEPVPGEPPAPLRGRRVGARRVSDQVDGQDVGQRLGEEPAPRGARGASGPRRRSHQRHAPAR